MAAVSHPLASKSPSDFLIKPSDNLKTATRKITEATAFAMRELSRSYREKLENSKPTALMTPEELQAKRALLKVGPWAPIDFYTRCHELGLEKLVTHFRSGNHFLRGYMDPRLFELKGPADLEESIRDYFFFRARAGQDPYKLTMDAAGNSFSIIDCGLAVRIAQYQTLALCLGKAKFNTLFSDGGLGRLNFSCRVSSNHQPLFHLLTPSPASKAPKGSANEKLVQVGEATYFDGHPNYLDKHFYGMSGGFNAICTSVKGGHRYAVFGTPIDLNGSDMASMLLEDFNRSPESLYRKLPSDAIMKEEESVNVHRDVLERAIRLLKPEPLTCILGYREAYGFIFNPKVVHNIAKVSVANLKFGITKAALTK